jgi:hypothetical protein
MAKKVVEVQFGALTSYAYASSSYTSSALGLGPLMTQNNTNDCVCPIPVSVLRPMEYSTAMALYMPWAMQWSNTLDWIFFADQSTAGATRKIGMAQLDRTTGIFALNGFVTVTFPAATNHTVRAFRMTYETINTGSVSGIGTTISGVNTQFLSQAVTSGSRIGFGSVTPSEISTWYEIGTVTSNTALSLITPLSASVSSGSSYVIEDLRAIMVTTNATLNNGGVYVVKGLRKECFIPAGYIVPAATTVDNIRATYWLADSGSVANTATFGAAIEPGTSYSSQSLYVLDTLTTASVYKYNIRRQLSLTAGKDTGSLLFKTGPTIALTGTPSQTNNGRLARTKSGPGSGSNCIYFTTTTRLYRSNAVESIASGSTSWLADNASEIPPGGTNTFAASSLINSMEFMDSIDKFIVCVNATTTPFRSYVTQYRTDGGQWDRVFGNDDRQIDQSAADSTVTPHLSMAGAPYTAWSENGLTYIATVGTTAITNRIYCVPFGADWEYASTTNARVITPEISTPAANNYVRVYVNNDRVVGGATGLNLGVTPEPYRVYYRTAGISTNSGSWTLVGDSGDLTSVAGATSIQFMFEFRTIGTFCVPARIHSVAVVYEDLTTDSHYQPSVGFSDLTNKRFAWRFSSAWGSTVPTLRVRLYDAVSGGLLVDDATTTPTGSWEKSTNDGGAWGGYDNSDKTNETTYIRYTPLSLGDNIKVRPVLTQL